MIHVIITYILTYVSCDILGTHYTFSYFGERRERMIRKIYYLILLVSIMFTLTACGESVQKKIYGHLEETVALEKEFSEKQKELVDLEKKEQGIYEKIIDLSSDELDEIKALSKEANELIDQRIELIELENDSLQTAKEEFIKIHALKDDLTDKALARSITQLYDKMIERYEAYDEIYKTYKESLDLEKQLYRMLVDEESTQEQLSKQIELLNEHYESIIKANKTFNKKTEEYNELKRRFYEDADLNVTYKDKN